uniref:Putative AC transposase n=1 Tax=Noccaea caerulescens TaxID=107243 RepID=A0A1J3ID04_NOCCA
MIRKMGLNKTDINEKVMASRMKTKFDKYCGDMENMNVMIFVACVMDPRYKLKYVSFIIRESYGGGEDSIAEALNAKIKLVLDQMYKHYEAKTSNYPVCTNQAKGSKPTSETCEETEDTNDLDSLIDIHEESEENSGDQTELESYLTDPCTPKSDPNFNVLHWWRRSASRYKTLSIMARDLMAIPVSTVASESAFSISGRVIDAFRSSLTPRTVETLICTQDWMRNDYEQSSFEEQIESLQSLEDEIVASNAYGNLVQRVSLPYEEE